MSIDRDKLIAAVYSASLSPEHYDDSLNAIDAFVSEHREGRTGRTGRTDRENREDKANKVEAASRLGPDRDGSIPQNHEHAIDPEILHHVQRATEIQKQVGRRQSDKSRIKLLLASAPNPAFIFDNFEAIVSMNDLAQKENAHGHFKKLADCCTNVDVLKQIRMFTKGRAEQKLLIVPGYINAEQNMNTCILVRKIDHNIGNITATNASNPKQLFLFTIINLGFDPSKTTVFKDTYGLTQAEVDVAVHLSSGLQVQEIAAKRSATIDTVRSQIKAIKRKTNSRDLSSIVRLVCGFSAGVLTASQFAKTDRPEPHKVTPLISQKHIYLRGGRVMHYLEQGDPNGKPVLWLHTIPYGARLMTEAAQTAKRMNLRILSPYRPGYGKSDALKKTKGDALLNAVSKDMFELLTALDIPKTAIVGVAMGSIYAMRFAALYPGHVSHLLAVSRIPMWRDEWIAKTAKRQRLIMRLTRYAPQLLPLVTRATMAYIDRGHAQDLFKTVCADSAADMRAVQNPNISDHMEQEFVEGLLQGCEVYHHDIFLTVTDFSQEALTLNHKFHILHGDDDKVVDPAQSQAFVDHVPGTTLEIIKDAGHLLVYSHWQHVLKAIHKKLG